MTTNKYCPETHPNEVFYELWLGATIICDCLDRDDHLAFRDTHCLRGKNAPHNGDDCWEQNPMAPVVQA